MLIKSAQQRTVWEYYSFLEENRRDKLNMLGPYKASKEADIGRHFSCANYEPCLGLASARKWESFTCENCRRTNKGTFL